MDLRPALQDVTIQALPVEILSHIFKLYIDLEWLGEEEFHDYARFLVRHCSPLILMQVCSHWRAIALTTPLLWAFICPSYDSIPNLRRWLAVCPKGPLHLQLRRRPEDLVSRDYAEAVLSLFSKEGYRWRSLSIDLDPDVAGVLLDLFQSQHAAPVLLEDLKVDHWSEDHWVSPATLQSLVGLLPRLRSLRRVLWIDSQGIVPLHTMLWSQLQTVIVKLPSSLEDIFSYLSQCTVATTIEFESYTLRQPQKTRLPSDAVPHITLPNLASLKLSRGCDPMWFLRHLTAPSLRFLDIAILRRDQVALDDFVKRSPCLKTLTIDERYNGDYCSYKDEVLISDLEIVDYLTSPSLRSIPNVGLDLLHTKQRILSVIQERLDAGRPLPPLLCWRPMSWQQRLVGWSDESDEGFNRLLFSYKDGSVNLTANYHFDVDFPF